LKIGRTSCPIACMNIVGFGNDIIDTPDLLGASLTLV